MNQRYTLLRGFLLYFHFILKSCFILEILIRYDYKINKLI